MSMLAPPTIGTRRIELGARIDFIRAIRQLYPAKDWAEQMIVAVLTGDIVASSSMSEDTLRRIREIVFGSVEAINGWEEDVVSGKPEFFRGDSWQLLLRKPQYLLRASLLIRARLLATGAADTRIAAGVGTVSNIEESKISLSSGEAFSLSGHALDKMKDERMVLAMAPAFRDISDFAVAVVRVCDAMVSDWTARQAEITGIALEAGMESHAAIVSRLRQPVSVQSIGKTLRSVHFDAVTGALSAFEKGAWLGRIL